jgi:hypothetical protein
MAMVVLVLPARADVSIGPDAAARLAEFGISHAALLGDDHVIAVVLEGWAFDPGRSARAAASVLAGGEDHRILRPVAEVSVATGPGARPAPQQLPHGRREG